MKVLSRIVFALSSLLLQISASRADTTFVSGSIAGMWTIDGAPYVINGAAWISITDTLAILEGVEVILPDENSVLRIEGTCLALGTDLDSVSLHLDHPQAQIRSGLTNPGRKLWLSYIHVDGNGEWNTDIDSVLIRHSSFTLAMQDVMIFSGSFIRVDSCTIRAILLINADMNILSTKIENYLGMINTRSIVDRLWAQSGTGDPAVIAFNPLAGDSLILMRSRIDELHLSYQMAPYSAAWISQCDITRFEAGEGQRTFVDSSRIAEFDIEEMGGYVIRCIVGRMFIHYGAPGLEPELDLQNNTFIWSLCCLDYGPSAFLWYSNGLGTRRQVTLRNNIFFSPRSEVTVLCEENDILIEPPSYNIAYGMSTPWLDHDLGPGNLTENPLFDPNSEAFVLQYPSMAINGGDPSLEDPDGSRRDIGAAWWDLRYDHPPIISTPNRIDLRWGDNFELWATATDDGPVDVYCPLSSTLPAWLGYSRALDSDTALLFAGRVPFGAESVTVPLIALDSQGQADSELVQINVFPSSILPDTIAGRLVPDFSPYLATHDVIILPPDSLTMLPGVTISFDSVDCMPTLLVYGILNSLGSASDSVFLKSANGSLWRGIYAEGLAAQLDMRYTGISGALYGAYLQECTSATFSHSRMSAISENSLVARDLADSLIIHLCEFDQSIGVVNTRCLIDSSWTLPTSNSKISLSDAVGLISECRIYGGVTVRGMSDVIIQRCLFRPSGDAASVAVLPEVPGELCAARIYNNTFYGNEQPSRFICLCAGSVLNTLSAEIVNNIFHGSNYAIQVSQVSNASPVQISNNCIWQCDQFLSDTTGRWSPFGVMFETNLNGDSTDVYANLIADPLLIGDSLIPDLASPCIDAGIDVGLSFWGAAPDIGYIEQSLTDLKDPSGYATKDESVDVNLGVYPNPANNGFRISFHGFSGPTYLTLFNVLGQEILVREFRSTPSLRQTFLLNGSHLPSGRYIIRVSDKTHSTFKQITLLQ